MTRKRKVLLVVEGHHDEAFVASVLRLRYGFKPILKFTEIDEFWAILIPKSFPWKGDLRARVPVPQFYENESISLAVLIAVGDSRLCSEYLDSLAILPQPVDSSAFILDADAEMTPSQRVARLKSSLTKTTRVDTEDPKFYVLPDDLAQGTLEDLLIDCAEAVYPHALAGAREFVQGIDEQHFLTEELKELKKNSGRKKAVIAAVSSILKPGKAVQTSLQDNRWICHQTLELERLKKFQSFLAEVLGL